MFKAAVLLITMICLVAGRAYSLEPFAKTAVASDGAEYVYVSLNSDMRSYQVTSKDGGADCLPYYQSIREKILARLRRNYTSNYNDGDVHLFFILNKEGAIVRIDVALNKSTKDTSLIDTALLSLQQAAPFGPFPKNMITPQVLFSLTVSFKKYSR